MSLGPGPEHWGGAGQGAPIFSTATFLPLSRSLAQGSALIINGLTTLGQALQLKIKRMTCSIVCEDAFNWWG